MYLHMCIYLYLCMYIYICMLFGLCVCILFAYMFIGGSGAASLWAHELHPGRKRHKYTQHRHPWKFNMSQTISYGPKLGSQTIPQNWTCFGSGKSIVGGPRILKHNHMCWGLNSHWNHCCPLVGMVIKLIVGVYIPIIRIPYLKVGWPSQI